MKKGYISFILFFLIAIIILYPFLIYKKNSYPLWPSIVAKETIHNHVLQKRAIAQVTENTFLGLKLLLVEGRHHTEIKLIITVLKVGAFIYFPPLAGLLQIIELALDSLNTIGGLEHFQTRELFTKASILLNWYLFSQEWEKNSNYGFNIFCADNSNTQTQNIVQLISYLPKEFSSIPLAMLSCYNYIEYTEEGADLDAKIKISDVYILTYSKLTDAKASSKLAKLEFD
jgi:hypothetical protein